MRPQPAPGWGRFFWPLARGRDLFQVGTTLKTSHWFSGPCFLSRKAWACTALVERPFPQAEAVPFMGGNSGRSIRKKGADDRAKINMNEAWEVDFWTHELTVSKDELQKVINKVGNSTAAVRRELGQLRTSR